jgi:hypothetical protein
MCRFLVKKDGYEERCGIKGWKPPTETETEIPITTHKRETEIGTEIPISTENKENELPCPHEPVSEDTITHTICHQLLVIMITGLPDHERLAINLSFYQTIDGPEQCLPTLDSQLTNAQSAPLVQVPQSPLPQDTSKTKYCPPPQDTSKTKYYPISLKILPMSFHIIDVREGSIRGSPLFGSLP